MKNVIQSLKEQYVNGDIDIQQVSRELFKHGFANFSNDYKTAEYYMNLQ